MNIVKKLALAGAAVCTLVAATPAEASWHGGYHYYPARHYWHGRWWGPGYYGPTVFVGAPFYWGGYVRVGLPGVGVRVGLPGPYYYGPRVAVGYRGPYYRPGWRYYHHRW